MYLVVIAWFYVAVMMALAEAFSANGTVLGAIVTFFLYGLLPIGLVVYLMGTPLRRKARRRAEQEAEAQRTGAPGNEPGHQAEPVVAASESPNGRGHTAG
jgi:Na+-transporting methylmalonyl-CoA/oxaloacetate decarboxylase gamma subunit